jgi:hypothetical protein
VVIRRFLYIFGYLGSTNIRLIECPNSILPEFHFGGTRFGSQPVHQQLCFTIFVILVFSRRIIINVSEIIGMMTVTANDRNYDLK